MFDKMKAMMQMQQKMKELKEELENTDFEVSSADNLVKIKMSAAQEVKEVVILKDLTASEKTNLEKALKDVYNRAIKRCQELATEKMKAVTGFNLPGLT